jgi:signal transduction histidine kinase/DNA-binding response OmpR family regulator
VSGETVLIVDNYSDNVKFIQKQILEPSGYKVLDTNNGLDALNIALSGSINLIISRLNIPKMGGLELLKSLRDSGSTVPVILTTSQKQGEEAIQAFQLGARNYIIKPFTNEELLIAVDQALAETRLRRERDQLAENLHQTSKQLDSRTKEMRILQVIGESITLLLDLEEVLKRIVEAAIYFTGAEEGSVMLLDEDGDLYLRAAHGLREESVRSFKIKVHDSIAGQVLRTGEPIIIGGQDEYEAFKVKTRYFVKSLINVPIRRGNQVIGVLAANNKKSLKSFSQHHLELISILADYTSIAIENPQLYTLTNLKKDQQRAKPQTGDLSRPRPRHVQSEMVEALGHLASGVAHEISPPINAILNRTRTITQDDQNQSELLAYANDIEQEALKCQQTIKNLLDYASQEPQEKTTLNLNEVIEAAWKRLKTEANVSDDIEVIRGYTPNLSTIVADWHQLEQAFFYILQRSVGTMPMGGTIRIITRNAGSEIQAIVTDTGHGVPAEEMRYLFDPFHKSTRYSYGLGLSVTYNVIENHNGTIEVDSRPGSGMTFTINLPAQNEDL